MSVDARSGGLVFVTGAIALAALGFVGATLVIGTPVLVGPAVAFLGFAYVARVLITGFSEPVVLGAASVALLLVGELSQWSIDRRAAGRYSTAMSSARALGLVALAAIGALAAIVGLVVLGLPVADETLALLLATLASVALLGLVAVVARASTR